MIESDKEQRESQEKALLSDSEDVLEKKDQPTQPLPTSSWLGPMIGNFSVQYNFQNIAIVLNLAIRTTAGYRQNSWVDEQSKSSVFVGCILGQMIMGYFGDVIGRGPALGLTLSLASAGALFSAILPWGQGDLLYGILVVCRFVVGFGLGGVYPLSAAQAAEASGKKEEAVQATPDEKRQSVLRSSKAFFFQAPGTMAPYLLTIILRACLTSGQQSLQWRLILGLGAVPSAFVVCLRLYEGATAAKKTESSETKVQAAAEKIQATRRLDAGRGTKSTNATLLRVMKKPKYWRWMAGTGGCWLLLDISLYGFGLMGPYVVATTFSPDESIEANSWQQFAALSFTPPAVLCTIFLLMKGYEAKFLQYLGFYGMAISFILFLIIRTAPNVPTFLQYAVYCLINFATWFGPIVTTFSMSSLTYPPATRGTLSGISSALSKVGAIIGTEVLPVILDSLGLNAVIIVNAVVSLLGALLTHTCVDNVLSEPIKYDKDELGDDDDEDDDDTPAARVVVEP